jgi:hypothetical protein
MFVVVKDSLVSVWEGGHMGSLAIVMQAGGPIQFLSEATYHFFL